MPTRKQLSMATWFNLCSLQVIVLVPSSEPIVELLFVFSNNLQIKIILHLAFFGEEFSETELCSVECRSKTQVAVENPVVQGAVPVPGPHFRDREWHTLVLALVRRTYSIICFSKTFVSSINSASSHKSRQSTKEVPIAAKPSQFIPQRTGVLFYKYLENAMQI